MSKIINIEYVKNEYNKYGFTLLEKNYINYRTKMETCCNKCKYVWKTTLDGVKQRRGCPKCSKRLKYNIKQIKEIYNKNNLILLETIYINNITKMKTKCNKCNYIWQTRFNSVIQGRGCPNCANLVNKKIEEIQKIYNKHNLILLEKTYKNVMLKMKTQLQDMPTNIRIYFCNACGLIIDRDYNSAINIKRKGLATVGEEWLHSSANQEATSFMA